MKRITIGIVAGIILGILDVLIILPVSMPNKELVLLGAFTNRFAIGLFSATLTLALPRYIQGALIGFLLSITPASYNPSFAIFILILGTVGGTLTGVAVNRFDRK